MSTHIFTRTLEHRRMISALLAIAMATVLMVQPAFAAEFTDDDNSVFVDDIAWMADSGITLGCNPPANTLFCPDDPVTRGQMAAFLVRAYDFTDTGSKDFTDDNNSVFENDIEKLAAAGVTLGCNPPANTQFCPDDNVTRGQMAAFLVRALDLFNNGTANFVDDNTSVFEDDIRKLATAGITIGCNPPVNDRFCPDDPVLRGQMAAFLHRAEVVPPTVTPTGPPVVFDTTPFGSYDVTALVYNPDTEEMMLFDAAADERTPASPVNAWDVDVSSATWALADSWDTYGFTDEPAGAVLDTRTGNLFISDDDTGIVYEIGPGADTDFGTGDDVAVRNFDVASFGAQDPEGIAINETTGDMFIANGTDSGDPSLWRLSPGPNDVFDAGAPGSDDIATMIDAEALGMIDPEGVVFDPVQGTFLVVDRRAPDRILELAPSGALVRIIDTSALGLSDPASLEFAPSSADPTKISLYVADRGLEPIADGVIYELRLPD